MGSKEETVWIYDENVGRYIWKKDAFGHEFFIGGTRTKRMCDGTVITETEYLVDGKRIWGFFQAKAASEMLDYVVAKAAFEDIFWRAGKEAEIGAMYAGLLAAASQIYSIVAWLGVKGFPNIQEDKEKITISREYAQWEQVSMSCFVWDVYGEDGDNITYGKNWQDAFESFYNAELVWW